MSPVVLLSSQFAVVVGMVVAASWWAKRRLGGSWLVWLAGAGAFVASQVLRMPLLGGVQAAGLGLLGVTALAVVTSGIFEEGARYVALRWVVKRARRAADGVVFGLGHGGIEAVLILGLGAIGGAVLLATGDAVLEAASAAGPDAVEALEEQIAALEGMGALEVALGVYERALAMIAHVAMTLLVLRAITERRLRWLGAAVGFHVALNGITVAVAEAYGIVAAEVALTGLTAVSVLVIRAAWRHRDDWYAPPAVDAIPARGH